MPDKDGQNGQNNSRGELQTVPSSFVLGDSEVYPERQIIRRLGTETFIDEPAMSVLCLLASRPGEVVSRFELQRALGKSEQVPAKTLAGCIDELREALGDDADNARYIEAVSERGYRLNGIAESGNLPCEGLVDHPLESGDRELIPSFWQELQQRRVFRAAVAYVIIAWALLQVIDIVFPLLGIPDWGMTLTFLVMLIGFPLVLLFAWTFQWDAGGLRYDSPFKEHGPPGFRRLSFGVGMLATALFSLLVWQSWEQIIRVDPVSETQSGSVDSAEDIPGNSIAVLRFANIGGVEEDEYFSDGLSEELLNVLARLREMKVVSRSSSWSLPKDIDVAGIRERLRVGYVLEGSVRRSGDVVRITAQLINTRNGYHLWSDTFDRKLEDILKVQDEVARQITEALQILLSERSRSYLNKSRITNVDAYDAYLQGLAALRKPLEPGVLAEAEQFFLRANELESGFAAAWAGLCKTRLQRYGFSRSVNDFEQAESACNRTLTLDETSPGVFEALGELYMKSGQLDKAERNYRSALVLAPNSAEALMGLGNTLMRLGKGDEAEAYLQQAVALDAGYWKTQNALGSFYFTQGQAEQALPYFRRVTLLAPEYVIGHNNLGAANMLTGNFDQAVRAFEAALALGPDRNAYSNAATAQFFLRHFEEAAELYQRAIALAPEDYMLWGNLGDALGQLGRNREAREAYAKAAELAEGLRDIDADDPNLRVSLARYYARLGRTDEARQNLAAIDQTVADMYVYYDMSVALLALGDGQASLAALGKALEAGYETSLVGQDPGLDALKTDPGFIALLESSGEQIK